MDQEYNGLLLTNVIIGISLICLVAIIIMQTLNCIKNERYYTVLRNGVFIRQRTESSEI